MIAFKRMLPLFCLALLTLSVMADDIRLGVPGYGGTGCPSGSASVTLSPDFKTLTILFDQYVVESGGRTGRTISRKGCNLAIPVHVPQGYAVSLVNADYRGYVYLPVGSTATFHVEYFFAGSTGPVFDKVFRGATDQDYLLENTLLLNSLVWSRCGTSVNLRSNSSMLVKNNSNSATALASVDSIDFKAGIIYHLRWKRC